MFVNAVSLDVRPLLSEALPTYLLEADKIVPEDISTVNSAASVVDDFAILLSEIETLIVLLTASNDDKPPLNATFPAS